MNKKVFFFGGERRKIPVLGPGSAVEIKHDLDIASEVGFVGCPKRKAACVLASGELFCDEWGDGKVCAFNAVGEEILFIVQTETLKKAGIVGEIPGHHQGGTHFETVHEQAAGIVG